MKILDWPYLKCVLRKANKLLANAITSKIGSLFTDLR